MSSEPTAIQPRRAPIPLRQPRDPAVLGRLPVPVSTLVGRERDVAAVAALLRDPAVRLATLTGPGGVGKTRLALQVAAEVEDDFADGVAFVELASIRDPALVAPAVVEELGLRPRGDQSAQAALERFLRPREALLVLDNFEQVVAAGPQITDLLRACPDLKVLVTSRTLLHVSGERAAPVPPLSLPRRGAGAGQPAAGAAAVRLFVERTREVRPGFALTEANATDVAEICRRLDGLPLAIELAAARGQLFSPAALLARLEPRLPELNRGPRDLPARLQTMRDAIAWSYDLLTSAEQAVFRCLGSFSGGCTLEAAVAVCGSPAVPDVVAAIESLADQSLVRVVDTDGAGTSRLMMLETVREFAVERLDESGNDATRRRYAAYYLELATRTERTFWGDEPGDLRGLIWAEEGNLRAALSRAIEAGDAETALRLARAMFYPQSHTGDNAREQQMWLGRALALPGGSPNARVRALTRWAALVGIDDLARAVALAEEALALARKHDDRFGVAEAQRILGSLSIHTGDADRSRRCLREALAGFRTLGVRGRVGWTLHHLSVVDGVGAGADLARASESCAEALAIFRELDHVRGVEAMLNWQAELAFKLADLSRSLASAQEALAMFRPDPWSFDYLDRIADVAGLSGRPEVSARLYGAADEQRERAGRRIEPAFIDAHLGKIDVARQALGETAFAAAYAAGRELTQRQAEAEALAFALPGLGPPAITLPPRAAEILSLLATGMSNAEIAAALYLSERTVERHVARLFAALGVHSRSEAVEAAIAAELLPASAATDGRKAIPTTES